MTYILSVSVIFYLISLVRGGSIKRCIGFCKMAFETDVRHVVTMHHSDFSPVFPTHIHAKMTRFFVASLCLSVLLLFALESIEAFQDDFQYGWVSIFFEQRLYLLSFFLSSLKLMFAVYNALLSL